MTDNTEEIIKRLKALEERVRHLEALENSMANNRGWDGTAWRKDPIRIGYSGDKSQEVTATATAGTNVLNSDRVPDGEIWEVQAIAAREATNAPTSVHLIATVNGIDLYLLSETASLAAGQWYGWTGKIVLSAGDRLRAAFNGSTAGDQIFLRYHAVRVVIDQ